MRIIKYDADFYTISALKRAIDDYQNLGLAKITLYDKANAFICKIDSVKYSIEETCLEFENYALELSICEKSQ